MENLAPVWARCVRMEAPENRALARATYLRLQRLSIREQRYALAHRPDGPFYDMLNRIMDVMGMSSAKLAKSRARV